MLPRSKFGVGLFHLARYWWRQMINNIGNGGQFYVLPAQIAGEAGRTLNLKCTVSTDGGSHTAVTVEVHQNIGTVPVDPRVRVILILITCFIFFFLIRAALTHTHSLDLGNVYVRPGTVRRLMLTQLAHDHRVGGVSTGFFAGSKSDGRWQTLRDKPAAKQK